MKVAELLAELTGKKQARDNDGISRIAVADTSLCLSSIVSSVGTTQVIRFALPLRGLHSLAQDNAITGKVPSGTGRRALTGGSLEKFTPD